VICVVVAGTGAGVGVAVVLVAVGEVEGEVVVPDEVGDPVGLEDDDCVGDDVGVGDEVGVTAVIDDDPSFSVLDCDAYDEEEAVVRLLVSCTDTLV